VLYAADLVSLNRCSDGGSRVENGRRTACAGEKRPRLIQREAVSAAVGPDAHEHAAGQSFAGGATDAQGLDSWARESGADVTGITPSGTTIRRTTSRSTAASRRPATSAPSAGLSMNRKDPMALKLESVELSARDTTGQQLTLDLQISGLVLVSQKQPNHEPGTIQPSKRQSDDNRTRRIGALLANSRPAPRRRPTPHRRIIVVQIMWNGTFLIPTVMRIRRAATDNSISRRRPGFRWSAR